MATTATVGRASQAISISGVDVIGVRIGLRSIPLRPSIIAPQPEIDKLHVVPSPATSFAGTTSLTLSITPSRPLLMESRRIPSTPAPCTSQIGKSPINLTNKDFRDARTLGAHTQAEYSRRRPQ